VPVLQFDTREPYFPKAVGYTIHDEDGPSASASHPVRLEGASKAIEFSIWWDWDIQHLYELEHVWVFLDAQDQICRVDASAHGAAGPMWRDGQTLPIDAGRVTLFSEPGKHAFAASAHELKANYALTTMWCRDEAGKGEILVPDLLQGALDDLKPYDRHVARRYMEGKAFKPSFQFDQKFDLQSVPLRPWPELLRSIPDRVRAEITRLRAKDRPIKAIFLDSGDTLIDEKSEVYVEGELVLHATPLPGGERLVPELKRRGYLVALVADGLVQSFENVHRALGFWDLFDARVISEDIGVRKPDPVMFETAASALGLTHDDYSGCIMVGNNLARDIAGAKRLGMRTVWMDWGDKYPKTPTSDHECPDFTIHLPHQLTDILDTMESGVC